MHYNLRKMITVNKECKRLNSYFVIHKCRRIVKDKICDKKAKYKCLILVCFVFFQLDVLFIPSVWNTWHF